MNVLIMSLLSCLLLVSIGAHAAGGEHGSGKAHRDNTTLFPQPQKDAAKGTAPASPEIVSPAFGSKVEGASVALTWKASEGADSYHVQVATDPNFKWLKADEHWVLGTSFEAKDLETGKHYYWRVAPWKNDNVAATNKGSFSVSSFETK